MGFKPAVFSTPPEPDREKMPAGSRRSGGEVIGREPALREMTLRETGHG
jgi:hypothetical protein